MNLALWVAQILAGAAFLMAGIMKSTRPVPELAKRMNWISWVSPSTVRLVGVSELAGGLGLILPWATGIARVLTPVAAAALTLVMILAAGLHAKKSDWAGIAPSIVLGALAAFVAWGRF
jgi:uncharacterized membrane protein YphA (DoxX/SURF4 family)